MNGLFAMVIGFILDLFFGDPLWLPHPVVAMGKLISFLEKVLRRIFPKTPKGELTAGTIMAIVLPLVSWGIPFLALWGLWLIRPTLSLILESYLCYQIFATKSLASASRAVYKELQCGNLEKAREAVGRIVGRETQNLSAEGVTKAAVETVAENSSDGVIAPMLFIALGGAPLGLMYKSINTMDSMVGYKNERYLYFGRAAARLDDAANLIPARICALLSVLSARIAGLSLKGAFRIFCRDRKKHASPNSAQTESVYAGALGVQLAGDAVYFGKTVHKKTIGDPIRPIEAEDINRANRLMILTAILGLALCAAVRWAVFYFWLGGVGCL